MTGSFSALKKDTVHRLGRCLIHPAGRTRKGTVLSSTIDIDSGLDLYNYQTLVTVVLVVDLSAGDWMRGVVNRERRMQTAML